MKFIKKVSVSSLDTSGRIIDSLNTPDNPHINAPSLNAVKTANAQTNANVNALADDSYYNDGETITFNGDGFYQGAIINGVWNIDTAYLSLIPRKKLKANQTVTAELTGFNIINFKDGSLATLSPSGVPSVYNLICEPNAENNYIIIKIIFSTADFNKSGLIALSGVNMRLTIHED